MKKLILIIACILFSSGLLAQTGPDWTDINNTPFISVQDYGAKGDGTTDDRAAIQAAIDAALLSGKELYFPAPSVYYAIKSFHPDEASATGLLFKHPTSVNAKISIRGPGTNYRATVNRGIVGVFPSKAFALISNYQIQIDMQGIALEANSASYGIYDGAIGSGKSLRNMSLRASTADGIDVGIYVKQCWVSEFSNVLVQYSTVGFSIYGPSTSVTFKNCYASLNSGTGYYCSALTYSSFISCASDQNTLGYYLDGCSSVSLVSCGAEQNASAPIKISNNIGPIDVLGFTAYDFGDSTPCIQFNTANVFPVNLYSLTYDAGVGTMSYVVDGSYLNLNVYDRRITRSKLRSNVNPTIANPFRNLPGEKYQKQLIKTASGTVLVVPLLTNTSGHVPATIHVKGMYAPIASTSVILPKFFEGTAQLSYYTTIDNVSLVASISSGITSVGSAALALRFNLAGSYDNAEVEIEHFSGHTKPIIDFDNVTLE